MRRFIRLFAIGIVAALAGVLAFGCGGSEPAAQEPSSVMETDHFAVEGMYVDSSYVDTDSDALKLVYLFATVSTEDQNLRVSSKFFDMTIGATEESEGNAYSSEIIPGSGSYMRSYYYSSFIEDVYVGESLKVIYTFKVPEGDLAEGKTIAFTEEDIPGIEEISFTTDEIVVMDNAEAIAQQVDPDGYAEELHARENADEETTARVQAALNDYEFWGSAQGLSYRISFSAPNNFELTQPIHNYGTYTVKNGYVELYYPETDMSTLIPYSWKDNGKIDMNFNTFLGLF